MKRFLLITRNFPPLIGGMERLGFNIYKQLAKQHGCDVIGPPGSGASLQASDRSIECRLDPVPVFLLAALIKGIRASSRRHYSACIAGSGLTAPVAVLVSRIRGLKSITFVHGLDLIAENRLYQWIFIPFIRRSDIVVANSRNTARLAQQAGVAPDRITLLHPGVELPREAPSRGEFRQRYRLQGKSVLLSVGRLIRRKGLAEFIRHSLPAVVGQHPDTVLVIIGSEPENALSRADRIEAAIRAAIRDTGLEQHVLLTGRADERMLQAAYLEADCFVFPLIDIPGDVEGFGMVAVEAAAHGLPTIAFAEGGVADAVSNGESGFLIPSGDYAACSQMLIGCLKGTITMPSASSCRSFAERFHWDSFGDRLRRIVDTTPAQTSMETE